MRIKSPYNLKKIVPMAMLALSSIVFTACDKEDGPKYAVTFTWGDGEMDNVYPYEEKVGKEGRNPNVNEIKLRSNEDNWGGLTSDNLVDNSLKPMLAAANGKGHGDNTEINGIVFEIPERAQSDSMFMVNNGWRVNAKKRIIASELHYAPGKTR